MKISFKAGLTARYRQLMHVIGIHPFFGILALFMGMSLQLWAQPQSLEMTSSSATANTTTPVTTPKTVSFSRNTDNPAGTTYVAASPGLDVTFFFANQQYSSVQGASVAGLGFGGGTVYGSDSPPAGTDFITMGNIGSPLVGNFSATGSNAGTGISLAGNYAVKLGVIADALQNSSYQPTAAISSSNNYYGDLVITFSQPVTNPVLHFAGMGADVEVVTSTSDWWYHGMSARFTLPASSTYTLTKLSGSTYFDVSGSVISNAAPNKGYNTAGTNIANGSAINATMPQTAYGASGSVRVNGTNITTITLQVAMDGDAGQFAGTFTAASLNWSYPTPGVIQDGLGIGISLPSYTLSGNVFNDVNGLTDNTVNGTGTNLSGALYAVVYDSITHSIAAVIPVASNGSYTATGILEGHSYLVVVTNNSSYTVGATSVPASTLPGGWVSTGENLGAGAGSDGIPNGKLYIAPVSGDVTNANFGIKTGSPLRTTILWYNGKEDNGKVALQWATAAGATCSSFDVMRSTEGVNWKYIGSIAATGDSHDAATNYSFTDNAPSAGNNAYYLLVNDIDGSKDQSRIATVYIHDPNVVEVALYPNPACNGVVTISGNFSISKIVVTDAAGRIISQMNPGLTRTMDVSAFAPGYYICTVMDENNQVAARVPFAISK